MRKMYMLLFLGALTGTTASTQETARINGAVKDEGGKHLSSATVSLLHAKDSSLAKMAVTDKEGRYEFANIKEGKYLLSASSVGFAKKYSQAFSLGSTQQMEAPLLSLAQGNTGLAGVTVVAKRPLIETKIDKMVVNVDASPTNAGNTALDVLEKSPGITVDRDGNISLKGKQGVIVLLDGKPSYLSGQDLANLLKNMPASQLDQIEIMTQPSAKFDASGNSGVINLKTKKSKQMGFNGSVNLSYVQGVYPKSPNSFMFNYRKGKVNLFSNLSYSYWEGFSEQKILRKFRDASGNISSVFDQVSTQRFFGNNYGARLGMDYSVSKKTTIGFLVNGTYNPRQWKSYGSTNIYSGQGTLDSTNTATSDSKDPWKNLTANLNFRRVMDSAGRELTADVDYVRYGSSSDLRTDNYSLFPNGNYTSEPFFLRAVLPTEITIYSGKMDYIHPLKGGARIEAGLKSSFVRTDNNAPYEKYDHGKGTWIDDDTRKDHFIYEENINAAYVNYSRQLKKWGIQTGLRYEHTHSVGRQVLKGKKVPIDYSNLFPTAYVSYALNDKNSFGLSYGRRVNRPNYQDLNPFQRFLDRYTYQQGNPYLTPQFSHNIEVSHNYRGRLNTTLNYTATTDIINDILKQNDATKETFMTKENIARLRNMGAAVSYNAPITKWWTTSLYLNVFNNNYSGIVNNKPLDVQMTGYQGNTSQQFRFAKTWSAEVNGFYRSKMQEGGLMVARPMGVVSFGFGKQILKNQGTVKLNITDPFYIMRFEGYTQFENIDAVIKSRWDNRRVGISFSYRFSKGQNIQARKRTTGSSQDEQNRAGGSGQQ